MIEKVGDRGSFKANFEEFANQGFVSGVQRPVLERVLEVGHATMHRSFQPSERELTTVLDITENIIESIYINEGRGDEVARRVPPRAKKQ